MCFEWWGVCAAPRSDGSQLGPVKVRPSSASVRAWTLVVLWYAFCCCRVNGWIRQHSTPLFRGFTLFYLQSIQSINQNKIDGTGICWITALHEFIHSSRARVWFFVIVCVLSALTFWSTFTRNWGTSHCNRKQLFKVCC